MKGCLKQHSPSPTPGIECHHDLHHSLRKCVAFEAEHLEEVHMADEWDRTPTEPARKLSYQDLLELKEIQLSLPRANQVKDIYTGRSGSHYLSGVPITLLPLLSEEESQNSPSSPTLSSPSCSDSLSWISFTPCGQQQQPPTTTTTTTSSPLCGGLNSRLLHPPHLSHLPPARPPPPRQKPRFSFLPLLDNPNCSPSPTPTPPSQTQTQNAYLRSRSPSPDLPSDTDGSLDPPTPSLTNASLDSSPHSRASSCSPPPPSPPFFQLPPLQKRPVVHDSYFPLFSDEQGSDACGGIHPVHHGISGSMTLHATSSPGGPPPSPLSLDNERFGGSNLDRMSISRFQVAVPKPTVKPPRKRNFIVVNDMVIELDDDEEGEDEDDIPPSDTPLASAPSSSSLDSSLNSSLNSSPNFGPTALSITTPVSQPPTATPRSHPSSIGDYNPAPTNIAPPPSSSPAPTIRESSSPPFSPRSQPFSHSSSQTPTKAQSSIPIHGQTQTQTQWQTQPDRFAGLHAPILFKRSHPTPGTNSGPQNSTIPTLINPSTSPTRISNLCSSKYNQKQGKHGNKHANPCSSPVLMPMA